MDLSRLKEPFAPEDLEWRLQSCGEKNGRFWGKALCYITSRAVQERLDEVLGPDNWQTEINKVGDAYLCSMSIRVMHEDGTSEWITRTDGADATDIEAVKGGISGAIKRVAVQFGIGRYLYNLKDNWAVVTDSGQYSGKTKDGKWFNWNPPALPKWALPENCKQAKVSESNVEKPSEETSELIIIAESLLEKGVVEPKYADVVKRYIEERDLAGLEKVLTYYEQRG